MQTCGPAADAMVANSMRDAGCTYVNISTIPGREPEMPTESSTATISFLT
jgi:hypothetical protein